MSDRPAKILIVDDEEQNLTLIQEVLLDIHCIVAKARDGVEALDKFDKFQPDLVLLDLLMPRLDGFAVCAQLKGRAASRCVPVVILTSLDEDAAEGEVRGHGADGFLKKPFDSAALHDCIHSLLPQTTRPDSRPTVN
jgi:CheY-like chemotaxis protein